MIKNLEGKDIQDVLLTKITFTFNKRWYEKYDIFEFNNQKYICISRPRKNEDNAWSIDCIPEKCELSKNGYDTKFIESTVSGFFQ